MTCVIIVSLSVLSRLQLRALERPMPDQNYLSSALCDGAANSRHATSATAVAAKDGQTCYISLAAIRSMPASSPGLKPSRDAESLKT